MKLIVIKHGDSQGNIIEFRVFCTTWDHVIGIDGQHHSIFGNGTREDGVRVHKYACVNFISAQVLDIEGE
jgi:hypothetical protein